VSADSSIGDSNRRRFFFRKREKEKALAATVTVTNIPASFVAVTKSAINAIVPLFLSELFENEMKK
jgi:hypothetical protein